MPRLLREQVEDIDFLNIRLQLKFFMAHVIPLLLTFPQTETTPHLYTTVVKSNSSNKRNIALGASRPDNTKNRIKKLEASNEAIKFRLYYLLIKVR